MWITEDDVNFETAKLKIGTHYVPVLVAHINKSLTSDSTLGVEADHLEAFSKKFFDALGGYDAIKSYGIPPTYYATGVKETTEHPLYAVIQVDDGKYRTETLPDFKFPYKCDETVFCKTTDGKDIKYWAGTVTLLDWDGSPNHSHYCSIYNQALTTSSPKNSDQYGWVIEHYFVRYDDRDPGTYNHIQSNYSVFLMIYSDTDNQFFAYHRITTGNNHKQEYALPVDIISIGDVFDYKDCIVQAYFEHQGSQNSNTIYIDFPVKDIVVKNYTPGEPEEPEEPSGDDNKGTKPNDHISIPDGDHNYTGDEIKDDGAPDDNPNSMGTMGLWAPTRAQYKAFCHYLWNGFQQAMVGAFGDNDGMKCVLACKEYPFVINATKEATMALGKVDTHLTINVAPGNYYAVVFKGTVKNPSHSFMDYSPYSKLSVYLPYIGITDLDIDQVSGKEVTITYKIDIVSGIGIVLISTTDDDKKSIIIGSYPVQMGKELPVTATDYQRAAQTWAGLAMTAVGAIAGAGLPMMAGAVAGAVAGAAGQASSATKADIKQSGSLGGSSGMLGISYPYFIYKMTNFSNSGYKNLIGKKSGAVVKLSTLKGSGYAKIEAVNLHIEGATDEELAEIKQDLLSGVIL